MKRIAAALSLLALPLAAQQHKHINLVDAAVPGSIQIPPAGNWKIARIDLYDGGVRPVFTFEDDTTHMTLSVMLFPDDTGHATAESCRKDMMTPLLQNLESSAVVKNKTLDTHVTPAGATLATASHFIANASKVIDLPLHQENIFGFLGTAHTCAEIHLSKADYKPTDFPLFNAALDQFSFDGDYQPTSKDYAVLASVYFNAKSFPASTVYYQRALDTLPAAPPSDLTIRRFLTDQLAMSYGIAGDIKHSRDVNEHAIQIDPDYPLYYYNLACADAEQGHAADARTHLQQAFDRKANTLPNEHLPDPATDDSILKLKKNKEFWAFVQTLSPQAKP
jgi:tetratricopeptide (TPR) repeat protein